MSRPTADEAYSRAKSALEDADRAAGARESAHTVAQHLAVATGWRELAESLAAGERRRPTGKVTVH